MEDLSQQSKPLTGEKIADVTVGKPIRIDGKIELLESDPAWPSLFRREEARIRLILGKRVRLLEHVGSTSVPGLVAKPILDLVLAVADSADEGSYIPLLETEGYVLRLREPDWFDHRLLKGPNTDINLHVFTEGAPEIDRMIVFRDHLRSNPDDLNRYAEVKRELAAREWESVQAYADAKSEVVEEIIERAMRSQAHDRRDHPV